MVNDLKKILLKKRHSIVALCNNEIYTNDLDGIKPVLYRINENKEFFKDAIVVDKIIGKASASLLVYSGVKEVYALILSQSGKDLFEKYNIIYHYDELVPYIINRKGDGICPMEETVKDIDDLFESYNALNKKVIELSNITKRR